MTEAKATGPKGSRRRARNRRGEGGRLREEIVAAATRILQARGDEDAVTLRAVAREAGIAAPSIYAHFPSPEAIVGAVVARTFDALTAALRAARDGADDPVQRLFAQCYGYVRFAEKHPGLYRVLFSRWRGGSVATEATSSDGRAASATAMRDAEIVEAGTPAFAILVEAIEGCVAAGRSASQNPFLDAVALWSTLHGYIGLRAAAREFPWPEESDVLDAMVTGQAWLNPGSLARPLSEREVPVIGSSAPAGDEVVDELAGDAEF